MLAEGHAVRALVRDPRRAEEWARQGVELHQGDFNDPAALAGALEGAGGAFLMLPPFYPPAPGFPEAQSIVDRFREALRQSPPPRLVALSSGGSEHRPGLGLITPTRLWEEGLGDLPFPTAFIRAGSFLENCVSALGAAESTGVFDSYWTPTDRALPMVAAEDIGKETAKLLTRGWSGKKVVELGSPVSPDDLARAMGEVLGRPVRARAVPREGWNATMQAAHMSPRTADLSSEMVGAYNAGWIAFGVPGTEPVAAAVTPAQVFARARKDES